MIAERDLQAHHDASCVNLPCTFAELIALERTYIDALGLERYAQDRWLN
jgi:hypothetical protein